METRQELQAQYRAEVSAILQSLSARNEQLRSDIKQLGGEVSPMPAVEPGTPDADGVFWSLIGALNSYNDQLFQRYLELAQQRFHSHAPLEGWEISNGHKICGS